MPCSAICLYQNYVSGCPENHNFSVGNQECKIATATDSVTATLGSYLHKQSLRATCLWQTHRVRCGLFRQSHGPDIRNMPLLPHSSFVISFPIFGSIPAPCSFSPCPGKSNHPLLRLYFLQRLHRHWSAVYWRCGSRRDMSVCAQFDCRTLR